MKISYAITVCNEFLEIQKLVTFLLDNKRQEDEIVILYDQGNGDKGIEEYLRSKSVNGAFNWHSGTFRGHFSDWKNKLTSLCNGDYIFNIDADELPTEDLIVNLPHILEINQEVDVFRVPRVNTVQGLTPQHIQKWGWSVNEKGWVNWPDYQWRIYKNIPEIKWKNKVHEVLEGYKTLSLLPLHEDYSIYHPKTITKQEKQNNYYETL
jgi:hypothetical protein